MTTEQKAKAWDKLREMIDITKNRNDAKAIFYVHSANILDDMMKQAEKEVQNDRK